VIASQIVSPEHLQSAPADPRLVLLDARAGADARARFLARHLRGARFVDGEHDLAAPGDPAQGGRHPLPQPAVFGRTLGRLGIGPDSRVVIYDDKAGANPAARAWWMLRAAGIAEVSVLDGGLDAAIAAGLPTEAGEVAHAEAAPVPFARWQLPTVTIEVLDHLGTGTSVALDARSASRHRGVADPFDPRPGHIPGSLHAPFESSLDAEGRMLPPAVLRSRFEALLAGRAPEAAIAYCGSGVTACHLLLAMAHAGLPGAALYVGSFSEWTRSGRPVATAAD